jgi:hypothetical protein
MVYLGLVQPDPSCSRLPFSSEILIASFLAYRKKIKKITGTARLSDRCSFFPVFPADLAYFLLCHPSDSL